MKNTKEQSPFEKAKTDKEKRVAVNKKTAPKKKRTVRAESKTANVTKKDAKKAALKTVKGHPAFLRKSKIADPVLTVWTICEDNRKLRRKDILALCAKKGIAFYTARTQYQLWKSAGKK